MNAPALILEGDCLATLAQLPDCSIDSIVTDPPYGLGKEPDAVAMLRDWLADRDHETGGSGFMGKAWDKFVPGPRVWRECLRVLKPGGHMVAFAGSRTVDLMGLAIRIGGFEIRDQLQWLYGTGFPKSANVSKHIDKAAGATRDIPGRHTGTSAIAVAGNDRRCVTCGKHRGGQPGHCRCDKLGAAVTEDAKRWEGYGTALKPAHEPIILARKPLSGTIAATVLEHGTGAMNIDGCRIGTSDALVRPDIQRTDNVALGHGLGAGTQTEPAGRWPANVILDPEAGAVLDEQSGERPVSGAAKNGRPSQARDTSEKVAMGGGMHGTGQLHNDSGGASRFFYCAKASRTEREAGLEHMRKASAGELTGGREEGSDGLKNPRTGAGRTSSGRANVHPTVKPIALMRWLVRLITPPGGRVLDPFAGSGTTGCAAVLEGFPFLGCELSPEYAEIARARIEHWTPKA